MQRNRSQTNKSNQIQTRGIENHNRDLLSLFKDDFEDPFDDFFNFGFGGNRRRRDELSLFNHGGIDSIFSNFRDMERDIFSK